MSNQVNKIDYQFSAEDLAFLVVSLSTAYQIFDCEENIGVSILMEKVQDYRKELYTIERNALSDEKAKDIHESNYNRLTTEIVRGVSIVSDLKETLLEIQD